MGSQILRRAAALVAAAVLLPPMLVAQVVVRGVLYDDATGRPLAGTLMLVDPSTDAAVVHTATDSVGNFSLKVRDGRYQIAAIRPGWTSVLSAPVDFANGEQLTIRVPIAESGDPTHRIGVVERIRPEGVVKKVSAAERLAADLEHRRRVGTGLQFGRARLEQSGVQTLGQFLQMVPGLSVRDPNSTASMEMNRSAGMGRVGARPSAACHVGWFLDGRRIDIPGRTDPLTDGLGSISIETIEAVEVFRGVSEMPAEFAAPDLRCGAVSIWLRKG